MPRFNQSCCLLAVLLIQFLSRGLVWSGEPVMWKAEPLDIRETEELMKWSKLSNTFVVYSMIFVESVSKHERWKDADRAALKTALQQLTELYNAMPKTRDLQQYRIAHQDRLTELQSRLGETEGRRVFTEERNSDFMSTGKIVTLARQQEEVWKIIDSLDGELSEFNEFKAAFLIHVLARNGPALMLEDPYIQRALGLDAQGVETVREAKEEALRAYLRRLNEAKCGAFTDVWNVLNDGQQEKLCRLLGKTERVILLEPTNWCVDALCFELRAKVLDSLSMTSDAISLLTTDDLVVDPSWLVRQNARLSDEQMKKLDSLISKALSGERGRFRDKTTQEKWVASVDQQLQPLIQSLKNDKRESAKALVKEFDELLAEVAKFRGKPPSLAGLRSKTPMIYYLHKFDVLDDGFVKRTHLISRRELMSTVLIENYLPFMPENPYAGQEEPADDALVAQFRQAEDLHRRWNSARETAEDYSARIEINNQYLRETKEIMLPFQYGETFRQFYNLTGLVVLFHYHDVAKDFNVSDTQKARLVEAGNVAADELVQTYEKLQRAALQTIFHAIADKKTRSFEAIFGVNEDRLIDLLLFHRDEVEFLRLFNSPSPRFRSMRLYEEPYDTGVRW